MIDSLIDDSSVINDQRFQNALDLFNDEQWYSAHDLLEEIWHETYGPERITIQGLLQIAVAQLHLENGNINGATILYGESLGRLKRIDTPDLGLQLEKLCDCLENRLKNLQLKIDPEKSSVPYLYKKT